MASVAYSLQNVFPVSAEVGPELGSQRGSKNVPSHGVAESVFGSYIDLDEQLEESQPSEKGRNQIEGIVGSSPVLREVLDQVRTVAPMDSIVLIEGETGTGKGLIAHAIHSQSQRRGQPFVKLNCAAIPTDLLESELFGHEKGAFTGAVAQKMGRFEAANGGTLFLDEIGDIPLELQSKLLRVLQEQEFERLGSTYTRRVDVGVVAATIQDLAGLIANKQFRMDLYYRLNVFPMTLPLLRLRMDDIPMLVAHFVQNFGECMSKRISKIPKRAMDTLMRFSRTPISGIRGIHGIKVIRGIEIAMHLSFTLIIKYLRMAEVLLSLVSRDGTTQSLQQEGRTMRSAKRYAFRLSSKRCSTCEDLRPLHARSEAALRNARSLYRATVKAIDSAALQNLEGELKQTSASRKLICYAIQAHLTSQHTQTRGVAWRRYGPGKES